MAGRMGLLLWFIFFFVLTESKQPSVTTCVGVILGTERKAHFRDREYTLDEYRGIPYAKPPVEELRFKRPEPFGYFPEAFNATRPGILCPQTDFLNMGMRSTTEDCLVLNIFVPQALTDQPQGYAVMVWIHGGGFNIGSGGETPGPVFAGHNNVIVVTINYRLGVFGFLSLGDERAKGNMGLLDQHLALKWIHNNIDSFGGDPNRVTIFGESAGGMSVHLQTMFPSNRGYFQNAIIESGVALQPWIFKDITENIETARQMAKHLGCSGENTDEVLKCLQQVTSEHLIKTLDSQIANAGESMDFSFFPVVDGEFIKRFPATIVREARETDNEEVQFMREINYINGMNGREGACYALILPYNGSIDNVKLSNDDWTGSYLPDMLKMIYPDQEIPAAIKELIAAEYTNWDNPEDAINMFIKFTGDTNFNVPGIVTSLAQANQTEPKGGSWLYSFAPVLEKHYLDTPSWVPQANHGDEIAPMSGYSPELLAQLKIFNIDTLEYIILDKQDSTGQRIYAREVEFWEKVVPGLFDAMKEESHDSGSPFREQSTDTCERDGNCG
ncbi:EST2E-like protein [Mya arenaria]|uniref:Carboxylic ester hydrolase n=1 Tax=Mya arenaria TaxID=6604 RepID=A0ABY7DEN7_MYAAR|nr:EST2E-like protein [Mya arenaria]